MEETGRTKSAGDLRIPLPPEVETLPHVCQKGLRDLLVFLRDLKEKRAWFKLRTPEELNLILPKASRLSQEIFSVLKPFKTESESWYEAFDNIAISTSDAPIRAKRDAISNEVMFKVRRLTRIDTKPQTRFAVWDTDWDPVREVADYASLAAGWEMIRDLPPFSQRRNPFFPFLGLFGLGAVKVNLIAFTKGEKLVADFPVLIDDDKEVLACLAFDPNGFSDGEIKYTHPYGGVEEVCPER